MSEKGVNWDKVGPLFKPEIGLKAFRIKIDPEGSDETNHRIIFDVEDQKYVIYKVGKRYRFYSEKNLEEVKDRK